MRVLGVDCGTEYTGFGIAECDDDQKLRFIEAGAIKLSKAEPLPIRLTQIFQTLCALADRHHPDIFAIEEVFYSVNAKSALKLGQVRGVALLAAAHCGLPVAEYAP